MLLVTGGAGFIGSNFITEWFRSHDESILTLDALTYAGNKANLRDVEHDPRHRFVEGNILDEALVADLFDRFRPRAVVHFAAESHVDRSISGPQVFVDTNVRGTTVLLGVAHRYWLTLDDEEKAAFRFINISTDEVYGSMTVDTPPNTEATPFDPSSPYSASKAAANQFGRAYFRTYGLPVVTVRCTNNYGPRQYPEKLLPFMLTRALAGKTLPVYGDGEQIRDWIHVHDFCRALRMILEKAAPGDIYNVGASNEMSNLKFLQSAMSVLDELSPRDDGRPHADAIVHVHDRPGHDRRYALDAGRLRQTLEWKPMIPFDEGLRATVRWYLKQCVSAF